jgi:hypothetical protein
MDNIKYVGMDVHKTITVIAVLNESIRFRGGLFGRKVSAL